MAKAKRGTLAKSKKKPYDRSSKDSNTQKESSTKSTFRKSKTLNVKNEQLTDRLDALMGDLSPLLVTKKSKKAEAKNKMDTEEETRLQEMETAQQQYEKTKSDMEDALNLLTKL